MLKKNNVSGTAECESKPTVPTAGRPFRRRIGKRYVRTLSVFLALGLVAHLLVAIGCAVAAQRHFSVEDKRHRHHMRMRASEDISRFWAAASIHRVLAGVPKDSDFYRDDMNELARLQQQYTLDRFGYCESRTSEPCIDAASDADQYDHLLRQICLRKVRIEAGWPARSLSAERVFRFNADREYRELERGHFPSTAYVRALPIKPMIGGLVLNTLLYSAAFFLLFAAVIAPGKWRRRRRIERGLCPACAYPVGINPVCTECGRTLS